MARIIVALIMLTAANEAWAEAWTCTAMMEGIKGPFLFRFVVLGNEVMDARTNEKYRLLQNNEYGLVATYPFSDIVQGRSVIPTVGATTIIINKATQEFRWEQATTGYVPSPDIRVNGKCIKD